MTKYHIVVVAFVVGEHGAVEDGLVDVRVVKRGVKVQLGLARETRPRLRGVRVPYLEQVTHTWQVLVRRYRVSAKRTRSGCCHERDEGAEIMAPGGLRLF